MKSKTPSVTSLRELFSCTLDMKVKSFNPLFSDVHNTIELHVHPSFLVCNSNDNTHLIKLQLMT